LFDLASWFIDPNEGFSRSLDKPMHIKGECNGA